MGLALTWMRFSGLLAWRRPGGRKSPGSVRAARAPEGGNRRHGVASGGETDGQQRQKGREAMTPPRGIARAGNLGEGIEERKTGSA